MSERLVDLGLGLVVGMVMIAISDWLGADKTNVALIAVAYLMMRADRAEDMLKERDR